MSKVYRTQGPGRTDVPEYIIRDGRFYRTVHHSSGWSDVADYEIRSDGKVYALETTASPGGQFPVYEFREIMLYRTPAHPKGAGERPEYYIYD
jgi:hypothetical protein